jgi:peptide deformylase
LSKKTVFINPEFTKISKNKIIFEEGCLSVPGVYKKLQRAKSLKIKATDEFGKQFNLKVKDMLARVIQHELDHLNGILIIDKNE